MALSLLTFEYRGLRQVISGGQCGSDYAGLVAARDLGVETAGYAPRGWHTHFGPKPELAEFGLIEHFQEGYPPRTEANVVSSDGTLIVASNYNSPGITLTRNLCAKHKRPFLCVRPSNTDIHQITNFIISNQIEILNVAGNRDKFLNDSTHYDGTYSQVAVALELLDEMGLLIKRA